MVERPPELEGASRGDRSGVAKLEGLVVVAVVGGLLFGPAIVAGALSWWRRSFWPGLLVAVLTLLAAGAIGLSGDPCADGGCEAIGPTGPWRVMLAATPSVLLAVGAAAAAAALRRDR